MIAASVSMITRISLSFAPIAFRVPISRVRSKTDIIIVFSIPIVPAMSAIEPIPSKKRIIVAITGASGALYARRLITELVGGGVHVELVISPHGERLLADELGIRQLTGKAVMGRSSKQITIHPYDDVGSVLASGSHQTAGMVICPCSANTMGAIASGLGQNLLHRAAQVTLKDGKSGGNRDFVLRYTLAGDKIDTGLLLYPGKDENFFLLVMEPPDRVKSEAVVPREYIFIVDVSGSMHGYPLDTAKTLMKNIITGLRPQDSMNVLLFASSSAVLSESMLGWRD